ncbi:hypothetical protein Tco_0521004 [Tanacetum coccineum]
MAQLLQAPIEGYEDAIVIPEINVNFELKHGLINSLFKNKADFGHDKEITCSQPLLSIKDSAMRSRHSVAKMEFEFITPGNSPDVAALTTEGNNFNQNRGTNFNQNRGNNFYQGQAYQPLTSQPPVYQAQPYQAPTQEMQGVLKTDFENYVKANDVVLRNMQNQRQGYTKPDDKSNGDSSLSLVNSNTASSSNSGSLPSNTVTNPKEDLKGITTRSGTA